MIDIKREWLIKIRKDKGLTQVQVAKLSQISQQLYNFIENGNRGVSVETGKKIAKVLGFDWTEFYKKRKN